LASKTQERGSAKREEEDRLEAIRVLVSTAAATTTTTREGPAEREEERNIHFRVDSPPIFFARCTD
jgi:hypothetical protein